MSELKTNLQSILQEKTAKIIPQNIKKDVEVLGVTGSYDKEDIKELQDELADAEQELADVRRDLDNSTATISGSGENVTLTGTAEARFKKPPLPMGNSEQVQYSGKQLIPFTNQDFTLNGVRHYVQNGTLYLNGTTTTETNQRNELYKSNFSMTLPAGTYYFKRGTSNIPMYIVKYDDNTNIVTNEGQFTLEETTQVYFGIYLYQITLNNEKIDCQLELGNSATSYEPYTFGQAPNPNFEVPITNVTGDVEVVVENKNLFDKNNFEYVNGKRLNDNGKVVSDADSSYSITLFEVKPNTAYTIQGTQSEQTKTTRINYYDINKNFLNRSTNYQVDTYTFTTPQNCYYIGLQLRNSTYINVNIIQLEQGSTATSYVPHQEQNFTFPLGNEKLMLGDYLADDGIHRVRTQNIFDGSEDENWEIWQITATNVQRFYIKDIIIPKTSSTSLCSHFKYINNNSDIQHFRYGGVASKEFIIYIDRAIETVEQLKVWLQSNPITVEYPLNEEVIVPYTSAQQEVYNSIKKALSYDKQTTVSGISSGASPRFDIIALRNMNDTLNTLENEIELLP